MTHPDCAFLRYSRHALERMFRRDISPDTVKAIVMSGESIAQYPDDTPYPSRLMLGFQDGCPIHVVVAQDPASTDCHVVTAYRPEPERWDESFKTRRKP